MRLSFSEVIWALELVPTNPTQKRICLLASRRSFMTEERQETGPAPFTRCYNTVPQRAMSVKSVLSVFVCFFVLQVQKNNLDVIIKTTTDYSCLTDWPGAKTKDSVSLTIIIPLFGVNKCLQSFSVGCERESKYNTTQSIDVGNRCRFLTKTNQNAVANANKCILHNYLFFI